MFKIGMSLRNDFLEYFASKSQHLVCFPEQDRADLPEKADFRLKENDGMSAGFGQNEIFEGNVLNCLWGF